MTANTVIMVSAAVVFLSSAAITIGFSLRGRHHHKWSPWRIVVGTMGGTPCEWQERHCTDQACNLFQTKPY